MQSDKLIPLGVLVSKCISIFKLPELENLDAATTSCQAQHILPFLMRAVNVNAWEELMFGRNPCTQQFHTARLLFIRELNNLVNTVVNSVFPRPTLKLTFKELDDNDVPIGFILKHGLTAIPQMKIEFHLSSYILKHVETVLKSTPILHHVLTNYANCIPTT